MQANTKTRYLQYVAALFMTAGAAIASGCLGGDSEDLEAGELETIDDVDADLQAICLPACPSGSTCLRQGCCLGAPARFTSCAAQSNADATINIASLNPTSITRNTYGSTACSSKLVVDINEAPHNLDEVKVTAVVPGISECECANLAGYAKLRGPYVTGYSCVANGCASCAVNCPGATPVRLIDLDRTEVKTADPRWDPFSNTCRVTITFPGYDEPVYAPGWGLPGGAGSWELHTEIKRRDTGAKVPVRVTVSPF